MNTQRSNVLRMLIHRLITYPLLAPAILGYTLARSSRCLDVFYSIRSMFHGIPMRNGLRMARYKGVSMIFPSREDPSFDDVWLREVYYPYLPGREDVVFDVGAHMGFFTLKVAKQVKEVIAFEPDPWNFKFLLTNIRYNDLLNVKAFDYALGDSECDVFLERGYGYCRTRITERNTGYKVRMEPLDTLVKWLGTTPDVIKMDVEGYEMKVLNGARSILARFKPKLIIAAYHYPTESEDVVNYLSELGFRCFIYHIPLVIQKSKETYVYAVHRIADY